MKTSSGQLNYVVSAETSTIRLLRFSVATVESVAAVVSRLAASTDYGDLVAEGFSEAMMSDAAVNHLSNI